MLGVAEASVGDRTWVGVDVVAEADADVVREALVVADRGLVEEKGMRSACWILGKRVKPLALMWDATYSSTASSSSSSGPLVEGRVTATAVAKQEISKAR